MPRTMVGTLRERQAREQQREEEISGALTRRKRVLQDGKRDKHQKRKTVEELLALLDIQDIRCRVLRPSEAYVSRSYNLDKQLSGLLAHLFVRYATPAFLFRACLPDDDPFDCMRGLYREWFVALAQGGSFPKLVKGFMTGREAYVFLSAPAGARIHENVWWAKMRVAGLPAHAADQLIQRIHGRYFFDDPHGQLAEIILFYARYYRQMDRVTFGETCDFLSWKLQNDPAFSLKGRTAGSVIKLTEQWHRMMQKARLATEVEWTGMEMPEWVHEDRDRIWVATELRKNVELVNEGRRMKHCVYSYVPNCVAGRSAIFSLRSYRKRPAGYDEDGNPIWSRTAELSRLTIEVAPSQEAVIQARGPLNAPPTDDQKVALRTWAGEKGFVVRAA